MPAFITALLLRFGNAIPLLKSSYFLQNIHCSNSWFTSNTCLIILGVLSIAELIATKSEDIRAFLNEADAYVKAGVSLLFTIGVLSGDDTEILKQTMHQAGIGTSVIALFACSIVFSLAWLRQQILGFLYDVDEDDDLMLQKTISFIEDFWVLFLMFVLIFFPIAVILMTGMVFAFGWMIFKLLEYLDEKSKIECTACKTPNYPYAFECCKCHKPLEKTTSVSLLFAGKEVPKEKMQAHRYRLLSYRRCPSCASRLKSRKPKQSCYACGKAVFASEGEFKSYLAFLDRRYFIFLPFSAALSLIPFLGAVAGLVYLRLAIIRPTCAYIPGGARFFIKWLIRFLCFLLLALQWIPFLGAISIPLITWIKYSTCRKALVSGWNSSATENKA